MNNNTKQLIDSMGINRKDIGINRGLRKVIGIVSYLPDGANRAARERRIDDLLRKINILWPWIDIMIVAQN